MIYVGSNEVLRAYMKNPQLSIDDIEEQLAGGARITNDGSIIAPTPTPTPSPTPEPTQEKMQEIQQETVKEDIPTVTVTPTVTPTLTPTSIPTPSIEPTQKTGDSITAENVDRSLPEEDEAETPKSEKEATNYGKW